MDPETRLILHNSGYFSGSYTKRADDWRIMLQIPCENVGHAKKLEHFIKRMKSRAFIQKLINDPILLKEIVDKKK